MALIARELWHYNIDTVALSKTDFANEGLLMDGVAITDFLDR